MADVTVQEDVALPAQQVWDVIGDFGGMRRWAVVVEDERVEEGPDGPVRVLTMPGGNVVREALVLSSQYSYTYSMLDRPEMGDYRGTVAVIPLDASTSRIVLVTHMSPTAELTEDAITQRYTKFLGGNLKAMKRALGVGG